jgi:hypothetical protein
MEAFTARNHKPGKYELKIDGQSAGTWADTQLAFRLELEVNDKTPQYQQAMRVALLNQQRNDEAVHRLRDLWSQRKKKLRQIVTQAGGKNESQLAAEKGQFEKWLVEEFQPGVVKFQTLARDYEEQIYQANQPAARKYELIRLN